MRIKLIYSFNFAFPKSFDLIVLSLVFHYIQNFELIVEKIHCWLKSKGQFLFSVEYPICTASLGKQLLVNECEKLYPIKNYRDEKIFQQNWFVDNVEKYHRTFSTYINTLFNMDFDYKNQYIKLW